MGSKKLLPLALLVLSVKANATGIPVYCYNCQEGSSNAAHAILDGIRAQTEALLNGMDYVMRAQSGIEMVAEQERQKLQNTRDLSVGLGAKPRAGCGQAAAAILRGASASAGVKTRALMSTAANNYNMRARGLAPKEPRRDYSVQQILTTMDEPTFDAGKLIMERTPIDPSDSAAYQKGLVDTLMVTNPFPVEVPSSEDIERIKKNGSPAEREMLAQAVAMAKRQQVAQYAVIREYEANTKRIEPSGIKYMLEEIRPFLTAEEVKKLEGKLSPNQLNELLATYRVRSSQWTKYVSTNASQLGVAKEQTLILAEVLNQIYELNNTNKDILKLLSLGESRSASQNGLISR